MQQSVKFQNRKQLSLSGALHLPDASSPIAYALYAHCFTCTKSIQAAVVISDNLSKHGIATLRFDFAGLGASKGDFSDSTFSSNVEDLIDAAAFLAEQHKAPQLLIGHSLGGTAVLAAAKSIPSANAVATIGSPSSPEHILHLLEGRLTDLEDKGSVDVKLAGRPFTFKQSFVDDVRNHTIDYRGLRKALMVMHSPTDDTVSINEATTIFSSALHPKSFVTLDQASHLLSNKRDSNYAADVLASWAMRYIELPTENSTSNNDHVVTASALTDQGFLCKINASGHALLADEPLSVGGKNLGPSPYDFLASALASCTAMTLNMYARHKKIDLQNVDVAVNHHRIHADDCIDCEKSDGKVDVFHRAITLSGNLSDAQRSRMLEIADRCPVHRTLENEIKITTEEFTS